MAVTIETPLHLKRILLPGKRHPVHSAVAALTADPFVDMNAVIEIHEIRQIVYARPINRGVGAETGAHRLQSRAGDPDLRMTVHASLGGRNVREAGGLHGGMAVAAIDPQTAYVMRVAERNRLLARPVWPRGIVRPAQLGEGPTREAQNEHGAKDGDLRERICTTAKQLRHNKDTVPISLRRRFRLSKTAEPETHFVSSDCAT